MNKDLFVAELSKLTPTRDNFLNKGLSEKFVFELIGAYKCERRENKSDTIFGTKDELLNLITTYNCSQVEIGMIRLAGNIIDSLDDYFVGEVGVDILAVSKITHEVRVLEQDNISHELWPSAANGSFFLDALIESANFYSMRIANNKLINDRSFTYEKVLQCSEKAGGSRYINFYKMLLDYLE